MVAIRGGRLSVGKQKPAGAAQSGTRPAAWFAEVQLVLVAGLVGTGTVLATHATADLIDSVIAALLLLLFATAQLASPSWPRRGRGDRPGSPPRCWPSASPLSGSTRTPPATRSKAVLGAPGGIGLADGAVGVLEVATVGAALLLLSGPAWLRRAPSSPHAGKLALVGIVAVTAIGVAGGGLAMFDLGGADERPPPANHHLALR